MRFAFHPILRVEERGFCGDAWAFTKSAGSGLKNAAVSTVEGVANLAKGGYKLATDGEAREKAWETTKAVASKVKDYGSKAIDDPEKAWNDARAGATSMYNEFKAAKDKAAAEGRSAEFWGEITGAGVFEVGTMLIPVGAASKLGKAGKAADTIADVGKGLDKATDLVKAADKAADLSKAAKTADKLEDAAKAANKAKQVSKAPALSAPDCAPGPVAQCPLKSGLPAKGSNATAESAKKVASGVNDLGHIKAMPKGTRPDPSTYLPESQIKSQLAEFDDGASRFMLKGNLDKYGPGQKDGTSFVMPKKEADKLIASANGDKRKIEKALGLPSGTLDGSELVRVDIPNPRDQGLRIPSGNETGANDLWIPGGKLPDGNLEAVIDIGPKGTWTSSSVKLE